MKRQPTDWEKIFVSDVTNKGLIFKIYSSYNSTTKIVEKLAEDLKYTFLQRRYTDDQLAH